LFDDRYDVIVTLTLLFLDDLYDVIVLHDVCQSDPLGVVLGTGAPDESILEVFDHVPVNFHAEMLN